MKGKLYTLPEFVSFTNDNPELSLEKALHNYRQLMMQKGQFLTPQNLEEKEMKRFYAAIESVIFRICDYQSSVADANYVNATSYEEHLRDIAGREMMLRAISSIKDSAHRDLYSVMLNKWNDNLLDVDDDIELPHSVTIPMAGRVRRK